MGQNQSADTHAGGDDVTTERADYYKLLGLEPSASEEEYVR
jgi:hypothetical protein